ncbi:hypothetical protein COJ22_30205 [Bacillus cereus]|nr:hypothetical protein COJ22_30205 [Bacillus cereus]
MAKKKSSKRVSFSAYQIDVQYIEKSNSGKADTIKDTWDANFFWNYYEKFMSEIILQKNLWFLMNGLCF